MQSTVAIGSLMMLLLGISDGAAQRAALPDAAESGLLEVIHSWTLRV